MLRFIRCFYHRWIRYEVALRAAALTYYAMFSIFPTLLLLTSGLGSLLRDTTYQRRLTAMLIGFLPQGNDIITRLIQEVIALHSVTNYVAAFTLLWAASGFLRGLLAAIVVIHDGKHTRNGLLLRAWSMVLLGLLMVSLLLLLAILSLASRILALLPHPGNTAALHVTIEHLVIYVAGTAAFYLLFRIFPKRQSKPWATLLAAGLTALAWGATNSGFARYLALSLPRLNLLYGSIAAVMALMLYLFFINLIVLAGALAHAVLNDLATCTPPPLPLIESLFKRKRHRSQP